MSNSIALIIPAHNEELVLSDTIQSAISQGQDPKDIYVVADASDDETMRIAIQLVGITNSISTTKRSKALGITFGAKSFGLVERYDWIHVADADGTFGTDYFKILREKLSKENAAATGYIRSREGSFISAFRVLEYTWGMDIVRRSQSWLGSISVIPGPSSIFRSDVFARLDWNTRTLAEDFDVTLQIYRQKLGPIQFIPEIKANTQDPLTFHDYVRQISRWNKGTFQSMRRHSIGFRPHVIDMYLALQVIQSLFFISMFLIVLPVTALITKQPQLVAIAFLYDVALTLLVSAFSAFRSGRYDVFKNFPLVYAMKWVQALVFMKYFTSIYYFNRHLDDVKWSHKVARYKAAP